jgi:predicted transposase YbfD/YdcC
MPNGVPRAQIFSNIFAIIEPDFFNRCLAEHIGALHPALKCQIIAIPHIIEVLALSGQILTLDAMGTHTHIAEAIIGKKADYILALKGNQGNLHKEVQDQFHFAIRNLDLQHSEGWSYDQRIEESNSRIVTRSVTVTTASTGWMPRSGKNGAISAA